MGPMKPSERVQVLVEFLGGLQKVEVRANTLESTNFRVAPQKERRTRGKNRRINHYDRDESSLETSKRSY